MGNFYALEFTRNRVPRVGRPLVPITSVDLAARDKAVKAIQQELLRPLWPDWLMHLRLGTGRRLTPCITIAGQTACHVQWARRPSAIDELAGTVMTGEFRHPKAAPNSPPTIWTIECVSVMVSGIDAAADDRATDLLRETYPPKLLSADAVERIRRHSRPLMVALSPNQELYENPWLLMGVYWFAEAFFKQFGVSKASLESELS